MRVVCGLCLVPHWNCEGHDPPYHIVHHTHGKIGGFDVVDYKFDGVSLIHS